MKLQLSLLLCLTLILAHFGTGTVIQTKLGALEGVSKTARNGDQFTAYYGVPYAKPPLGNLRFRAPEPVGPWEGVRTATDHASECMYEVPMMPQIKTGSEDCLFLNVFTKHPGDNDAKKPVVVWVHGGGFIFGGAVLYPPEYFLEEDVVLVVIQYRLNVFGFLSFEDPEGSGNYGMLDQVQALKWVKDNIATFGGDPDSVTIFGMSAGGASIHYHMLSPKSRGLFKNAIALSGTTLNWWANFPDTKSNALKVVEAVNCERESVSEMLECLRGVDADKLFHTNKMFFVWEAEAPHREPATIYSPRWDPEAKDPFMPEHPLIAMQKGNINPTPFILGMTDKEGCFRAAPILPDVKDSPIWKDYLDNFDDVFPYSIGLFGNLTSDMKADVQKVLDFYKIDPKEFTEDKLSDEKVHALIDVLTDSLFTYGVYDTANLHAQHAAGPTYFYMITYPTAHSLANFGSPMVNFGVRQPPYKPLRLAGHGTDMMLFFPMFPEMGEVPHEDVEVSRKFIKLVVDFASNGKPTVVNWPEYSPEKQQYLDIGYDFEVKQGLPHQANHTFWDSLGVYWNNALKVKRQAKNARTASAKDEF